MFFGALRKYIDIVDVIHGMLPINRCQNNVPRSQSHCQSISESKRHALMPIRTVLCDKRRLFYVGFVKLNPPIATFGIQRAEYVG